MRPGELRARAVLMAFGIGVLLGMGTGCGSPTPAEVEAHRRQWNRTPAERCHDICAPAPVLSFEHNGWSGTTCKCGGTAADGGAR